MAWVLKQLYVFIPNYGWGIVLLTLIIKLWWSNRS